LTKQKKDADAEIIVGGNYDKSVGYFIEPTVIVTTESTLHYNGNQLLDL
jgi:1-pyrroline-5-carboxylate dehydrogenase